MMQALDPPQKLLTEESQEVLGWREWLLTYFLPFYQRGDQEPSFASFHIELWEWVWSLNQNVRPDPLVAIWPRETGKSTNAEIACIALGHKRIRSYILYVSGTQVQANDHVGNIAAALESTSLRLIDPDLCERQLGKYGQSKGWRMNRLRTQSGLTIDAVGLDAMGRGAKIDNQRPDFLILDDIDKDHDT